MKSHRYGREFFACVLFLVGAAATTPAAANTLCLTGQALAVTDPTHNRILAQSTGSGIPATCSLSGSGTAVRYDTLAFNITGCAVFPTQVIISTCGSQLPGGACATAANVDTVVTLYRTVPLTTNGGGANPFTPAAACTNALALNDDLGTTPTSAGGSSCDQNNTADCHPICSFVSNSGMKRTVGSGLFTVVVAGFGNATTGNYNLTVSAAAAGCVVSQAAGNAPVANAISPPAFNEDTASSITLSYTDAESDLATACAISGPTNVTVTTPCACTSGVCTVGVTGTANYNGPASFGYTVTANAQTSATATASLTITSVNDPPVINSTASTSATEDVLYTYNATRTDVDGSSQAWALSGTHSCGGAVVATSGVFTFTPAGPVPPSSCVLSLVFCDSGTPNECVTQTTVVSISAVNDAPVINSTAPTTATEDTLYTYNATRSDADGPGQTWSLFTGHTCGGSVVAGTGVFTFTPTGPVPLANCVVAVQVCDNAPTNLCTSQSTTVTINAVNDAPVIDSTAPTTATEDTLYTYNATRSDADGPGQTWTLAAGHTCGGGVVPATGVFTFTPTGPVPIANCVVALQVCDNAPTSLCATQSSTITITAVNDVPVINSTAPTTAVEDTLYTYNATRSDADGPGQAWSLLAGHTCGGNIVAGTGVFTFTPPGPTAPSCVVGVQVCDNGSPNECGTQSTTVTITAVNDTPTLAAIADPPAIAVDAGLQTVNLTGIGPGIGDPAQVLSVTAISNNVALIPNPSVSYTSPNATGSLSYTPVSGQTGSAFITVTVMDNGGTANGGVNMFSRNFTQVVVGDLMFTNGFE